MESQRFPEFARLREHGASELYGRLIRSTAQEHALPTVAVGPRREGVAGQTDSLIVVDHLLEDVGHVDFACPELDAFTDLECSYSSSSWPLYCASWPLSCACC